MNAYSKFVNDSFSMVSELIPQDGDKLRAFAFGENTSAGTNGNKRPDGAANDYASLTNSKAALFYALLSSYAEALGIGHANIKIARSKVYPDSISIRHSCYTRNLRRWMNGQKSRKALNRLEYVVLIYCWSIDWYDAGCMDRQHVQCRERLISLCTKITGGDDLRPDLLSLLWAASRKTYAESYAGQASADALPGS